MVKSLNQVIRDIQDYFGYRKPLHLSLPKFMRIQPMYLVNAVPGLRNVEVVDRDWETK